jgi:DNA (cytosine-5)-methyltransferase 1
VLGFGAAAGAAGACAFGRALVEVRATSAKCKIMRSSTIDEPQFASLFSGCGGFDLGFATLGFRPVGAFDHDPDALENYTANVAGPVRQVDLTRGVPDTYGLHNLDALIAGPPCQGFSTAGKRDLDDERNHLMTRTASLATQLRPKVLVIENVPGVLSGDHGRYLKATDSAMRSAGYRTHTMLCDTSDLGMAQHRRRVLFFAWNTGRDIQFLVPNKRSETLKSALTGVDAQPNHGPRQLEPFSRDWRIARRIKPGQKLCNVRGGENAIPTWDIPEVFGKISKNERTVLEMLRRLRRQNRERNSGDADPVSIERLDHALGVRFRRLVEGLVRKGFVRRISDRIDLVGTFNGKFRRLCWEKPSSVVDTRFGSPRYFLHPSQDRGFTVREAARIQGFPDSYVFQGSESTQYRVIGNAVPPPLARLAATFTAQLLGK